MNAQNETALHIASQYGKLQVAEVLLFTGKCSQEDIRKAIEVNLLLHQAVAANRLEFVEALLKVPGCNINELNSDGETPLHVACKMRHSKAVLELLIENSRCDLNAQTQCGDTALYLALCSEQEVVEKMQCILQSERYNPNITNTEGYTPLHVALKKEEFETAVALCNHSKCNPNIQDLTGNTPLHMAIGLISLSSVESLLNHKSIDLNIQNNEGNTPLHEAVMRWIYVDVVKALALHKSCNPSIVNNAGMTPLQISATSGDVRHTEVLITSERYSHKDIVMVTKDTLLLHQAVLSNRPKLALRLINVQECNINEKNSVGETALHVACKTRCSKAVLKKLTEDSRCDLNAQDQHGNTALHLAVYSGTDVAEKVQCILQSERCNPNVTNSEGYTPLHVAAMQECNVNAANSSVKELFTLLVEQI